MDAGVGVPVHIAKEKPPINVVGDVGGRIAIIVVCLSVFLIATTLHKDYAKALYHIVIIC